MASRRLRRLGTFARTVGAGLLRRASSEPPAAPGPRIVFTITNGRSGSEYLSSLVDCVDGVVGRHEPAPYFQDLFRDAARSDWLAKEFLLTQKLPKIKEEQCELYIETSHLFGKGYFDAMLELGVDFGLIVLRRDAVKLAHSMYRLATIPERTRIGRYFYLGRDDKTLTRLTKEDPTDLDLCLWHALETEARQKAYAERAERRGLRVFDTSVEKLNQRDELEALLNAFDVAMTQADHDRVDALLGRPKNARVDSTHRELSLEEARAQMDALRPFIAMNGEKGPDALL